MKPPDQETPGKTERELRTILETIPAFVWTARPDGAIDFITGRLFAQTGLREDETLMWEWTKVLHPEDRERVVRTGGTPSPRGVPPIRKCGSAARMGPIDGS